MEITTRPLLANDHLSSSEKGEDDEDYDEDYDYNEYGNYIGKLGNDCTIESFCLFYSPTL